MTSNTTERIFDSGSLCVWCARDTSAGSGRFVNRIPVYADIESSAFFESRTIRDLFDYVEGYGCEECYAYEEDN
jgi:hypothetical protein